MADVVFLVLVAAFFAVCVLFVKACAALAGPDPTEATTPEPTTVEPAESVQSAEQVSA